VTIVVPPTLPLAMSVGTNFAFFALRALNMFCISPGRINVAGKLKCVAF
jgi:cation-transporting ATPase 13A2